MRTLLNEEKNLWLAAGLGLAGYLSEHWLLSAPTALLWGAIALLFAAIIGVAMRVAHHAEMLAAKLGEPFGTMILTLSAVAVEVVILAVMMLSGGTPTLARDTVYAALMLDINGILGVAAIIGGLKYGEQPYNLDSGNSYVAMILVAVGIAMFVPEFVPASKAAQYSAFTIVTMLLLYGLFLRMQTGKHSYFFDYCYREHEDEDEAAHTIRPHRHAALLGASIVLIGIVSEILSTLLGHGLAGSGLPDIVPAMLVAVISASPEILTAMRAALANRMQAVLNIALGASLATVVLTVPVIEGIALATGKPIQMALTPEQTTLVLLTLLISAINLHDGETNAIEGYTYVALFATFVFLALIGL
jgi:Ca2+:H+ antiporter